MIPRQRFLVLGTALALPMLIGPSMSPANAGHDKVPCSEIPVLSRGTSPVTGGVRIVAHLTKCTNERSVGPFELTVKDAVNRTVYAQRITGQVVGSRGVLDVTVDLPPGVSAPTVCILIETLPVCVPPALPPLPPAATLPATLPAR